MRFGRRWFNSWSRKGSSRDALDRFRSRRIRDGNRNGWKGASGSSLRNVSIEIENGFRTIPWSSCFVSGSLSLVGDAIAQVIQNVKVLEEGGYDLARTCRMGTFGFFFYGPYQHYWYRFLDRIFPMKKQVSHFASKVVLNQLVLAPIVLLVVFSWNLALQGKRGEIGSKVKRDLVPTMLNGWKFWVPASSINFWLVPLRFQVLYMSSCGVYWNAYLSLASNRKGEVGKEIRDERG